MYKSAVEILSAIGNGEISSVEILTSYLKRIEKINPEINAVIQLDTDRAMERAQKADKALSSGDSWGLLHGLPMTVKDAFEVSGIVSTGGAKVWKNHTPETNAEAVQKLIDAGAIILAKLMCPYF